MKKQTIFINLPSTTNVSIISNKTGYTYIIYNEFFFYKITKNNCNIQYFDNESHTLVIKDWVDNPFNNLFLAKLDNFLFSWSQYFHQKIKFTGKGYRITFRKKRKIIFFYFGHSHDTIMVFRSLIIIQPHKYKFVFYKNSLNKIRQLTSKILKIKPMNIYTRRGLRLSKQIILKRKGEKSAFF